MTIEVGDKVLPSKKPDLLMGALLVLKIEGGNATCLYYVSEKESTDRRRPSLLVRMETVFPLKELTVVEKAMPPVPVH
ncbi:hypothetical protein [Foetidibacter luteolus]|uniref:hypothetical protein n=1 Tax=Foetidibacter luteolus TaxID=2608880 RepID=UPI00129BC322|nr:hypothetical protein [Foetidibacter luteolus]